MNPDQERMTPEQEGLLRGWLDARDPGDAPARLRAAVREVPHAVPRAIFPAVDAALGRFFVLPRQVRAVLLLVILAAIVSAVVGAAIVRPWEPFPPPGLIAYTAVLGQATGSTGIRLVAADGTGERAVTEVGDNLLEQSPRWSPDGRTLLFARVSNLDPNLAFCAGGGSIVLYDIATSTERLVATDLGPIQSVSWSPDGGRVAFAQPTRACGDTAHLGVLDLASGRITDSTLDWGGNEFSQLLWVDGAPSAVRLFSLADVQSPAYLRGSLEDVPSSDGRFLAASTRQRDIRHRLVVIDRHTTAQTDLGVGGAASWSPDNTAVAFIQLTAESSEFGVEFRDQLALADVATRQVRILGDVIVPDIPEANVLPSLHWSNDRRSIYWMDATGGHVIDVASGRAGDLPAAMNGCDDLQWQPLP
jgi:dipeptidyl aminopeptidase/acylaminoacyl peptidase